MKIEISIPEELEPFENDLHLFFELMVRKLYINRHKGFAEGNDADRLINRIADELTELRKAYETESQFNVSMEAIDVANFSFLTALKMWSMTVHDFKTKRGN